MSNSPQVPNNQGTQNSTIDLKQIADQNNLDVELKIKTSKNRLDYFLEFMPQSVMIIILVIVTIFCFQILNAQTSTQDDKKFAQSMLTLIVGGSVGFVTGRATASKN
ncbi:MAG: hypothetical protein VKJ02_04310 [Snowella sp.]|nr:hypothetical protein [Snowella sp.]